MKSKPHQFIFFHGAFGYEDENWIPYMRNELEKLEQKTIAESMPQDPWDEVTENGKDVSTKNQNLKNWLATFDKEVLPQIITNRPISFVGHSLGCVFILHILENHPEISLDSSFFVAPFTNKLGKEWQIDHANETFYTDEFNFKDLSNRAGQSYVLYSDNDPYVDPEAALSFADRIESQRIEILGMGHMSRDFGLTEFPLLLELCKTRVRQEKEG